VEHSEHAPSGAVYDVAQALFTTDAGPPPSARLAWALADVEDFTHKAGPRTRLLFRAAIFGLVWIAPLLLLRPPLVWQSLARRIDSLERIERGPFHVMFLLVKVMLCLVYFEHPDSEREIGFDGKCLKTS
jgi:hypothetical protein